MIEAIDIMLDTGITYDAVHAAAMKTENIHTVITEDVNHWSRIEGINIIRPLDYTSIKFTDNFHASTLFP